jgi:hypothetical protein
MPLVASLRRLARAAGTFGSHAPLPAREGYALWADTYPPQPHNPLMAAEEAIVRPILEAATPTRALDVGTGTGRCLGLLRAAGARTVVGLDMSLAMLGRTSGDLPCVCGDACRLPFDDASFDVVCASPTSGPGCGKRRACWPLVVTWSTRISTPRGRRGGGAARSGMPMAVCASSPTFRTRSMSIFSC